MCVEVNNRNQLSKLISIIGTFTICFEIHRSAPNLFVSCAVCSLEITRNFFSKKQNYNIEKKIHTVILQYILDCLFG